MADAVIRIGGDRVPVVAKGQEGPRGLQGPAGNISAFATAFSEGGDRKALEIAHDDAPVTYNFGLTKYPMHSVAGDNYVMSHGWNVTEGGTRENTDEPNLFWSMEWNFANVVTPAFEMHLQGIFGAGGVWAAKRPWSWYLPRDGSADEAACTFTISKIDFQDYAGTQVIIWDLQNKAVDVLAGTAFGFHVNNYAIHKQLAASGVAFVELPYADNHDCYRLPIAMAGSFDAKANTLGVTAGVAFQVNALVNGAHQLLLSAGNAVTGELNGLTLYGNASAVYTCQFVNQHASGVMRHALIGKGEIHVLMSDQVSKSWTFGLEAVSGEFRIAPHYGSLLGAQGLKITPAGKVLAVGGIGVGNSAAASTPGTVVKKMEVFDADGNSLGFVPIYDAIT